MIAKANANNGHTKAITTKTAYDLSFIGHSENYPVFELKLANGENAEYSLEIKDVTHSILHTEKIKGNVVNRKFRLDVESEDLKNIRFVLTNTKTNQTQEFGLKDNSYVIDNISVTPL